VTTRVAVSNADGSKPVKVITQEKTRDGEWKNVTFELVEAGHVFNQLWVYSHRRFIIEEIA
jgi:hypothetical protein